MPRESMSRGDVLLIIAVLAVFGVVTSAYLAWQWYEAARATWCDLGDYFSCTKVRESPYAAVAGIPTAAVGIVGFAILFVLAALALRGIDRIGPWSLDRWLLFFAILGALTGIGLTFVEIFVIQAICILCVLGFVLDLGILGLAAILVRSPASTEGTP